MVTFQQPASAHRAGPDVAAWALIAIVVAALCAAAGWAIARQGSPSYRQLARETDLAAREGVMRGEAAGYGQGARLGRREASLRNRSMLQLERRRAARDGYDAGWYEGRSRAGDPDAYLGSTMTSSGAYPSAGYEDILASGLFGSDAAGYASSAYDSVGYGTGSSLPYLGVSASERFANGW